MKDQDEVKTDEIDTMTEDRRSLSTSKALSMVAALFVLLAGWSFTMIISAQQHIRERQEILAERTAHLEASVKHVLNDLKCSKQ